MKTLLLPLLLALLGTGGGVAAALFLGPFPAPKADGAAGAEIACAPPSVPEDGKVEAPPAPDTAMEYVKISNQFVVPVVAQDRVEALVVLSLSVEIPPGRSGEVYQAEPKLRDAFLGVLFEHANAGHFDAGFTRDESLRILKRGLREVGRSASRGLVSDVLITEIARQDA